MNMVYFLTNVSIFYYFGRPVADLCVRIAVADAAEKCDLFQSFDVLLLLILYICQQHLCVFQIYNIMYIILY